MYKVRLAGLMAIFPLLCLIIAQLVDHSVSVRHKEAREFSVGTPDSGNYQGVTRFSVVESPLWNGFI